MSKSEVDIKRIETTKKNFEDLLKKACTSMARVGKPAKPFPKQSKT
jgi:hypothetical protein